MLVSFISGIVLVKFKDFIRKYSSKMPRSKSEKSGFVFGKTSVRDTEIWGTSSEEDL